MREPREVLLTPQEPVKPLTPPGTLVDGGFPCPPGRQVPLPASATRTDRTAHRVYGPCPPRHPKMAPDLPPGPPRQSHRPARPAPPKWSPRASAGRAAETLPPQPLGPRKSGPDRPAGNAPLARGLSGDRPGLPARDPPSEESVPLAASAPRRRDAGAVTWAALSGLAGPCLARPKARRAGTTPPGRPLRRLTRRPKTPARDTEAVSPVPPIHPGPSSRRPTGHAGPASPEWADHRLKAAPGQGKTLNR